MEKMRAPDRRFLWGMLAPAVFFLFVVTAIPTCYVLYASFSKWSLTKSAFPQLTGFENYIKLFTDEYFYNSLRVTVIFTVVSLIFEMILGTGIALLLFRQFKGRAVLRSLILLPMMVTPAVVGLMWRIMLNSDFGIINYIISVFGGTGPNWLSSETMAMVSIIMVDVWEWTPFVALSVLASLQTRSQDQVEGALIDGANTFQIFRYITYPHIQPILFISGSFRLGALLRWFDTIYVMTSGGPGRSTQNLPMYIYQTGFYYMNMGYSAALAVILLILTIFVTYLVVKRSKIDEH